MEKTPVQYITGYVLYTSIMILLLFSFYLDNFSLATVACYLLQLRMFLNFTVPVDYSDEYVRFRNLSNMIAFTLIGFFNFYLITKINPWRKGMQNFINFILLASLDLFKLIGIENLGKHAK